MKYIATVDGRDFAIDVEEPGAVEVDDEALAVDLRPIDGQQLYSLLLGPKSYELYVERREGVYYILLDGDRYAVEVEDARLKQVKTMSRQEHEVHGQATVAAPMPGLVVRVLVAPGDAVAEGQGLAILEAMKMENEIRAPRPGVITSVQVEPGRAVNLGDVLMTVGDAA